MRRWICIAALCAACSGTTDEKTTDETCAAGESINPVTGTCETAGSDMGSNNATDTGGGDDTPDMGNDDEPDLGDQESDMSTSDMDTMSPDMDTMTPDMNTNPGDWPPMIESLHSPGMCNVPACDENGDPGFDPSGMWVTTLTTAESDCSDFIKMQDERANVGNVDVSDPEALRMYNGECGVNDMGTQEATSIDGIAASCARNEQQFDIVSFETALVEYDGDTGTGQAFVYLENVPSVVGDDCFMRFDILQERQ